MAISSQNGQIEEKMEKLHQDVKNKLRDQTNTVDVESAQR